MYKSTERSDPNRRCPFFEFIQTERGWKVFWGPLPKAETRTEPTPETVRVPAEIVERATAIEENDNRPITLNA